MFIEKRVDNLFPWEADENHKIEVEDAGTEDEYTHINSVSATGRNYELFELLAGVRGTPINAVFEQRGLPNDLSEMLKSAADQWAGDGHSHSYLSLEELKEVLVKAKYDLDRDKSSDAFFSWKDYDKSNYKDRPEDYVALVNYCEDWIDSIKQETFMDLDEYRPEVRLIFWFDN